MPERTKRGEEDRKREDDEIQGEPVGAETVAGQGTEAANTTRDRHIAPARDTQQDDGGGDN